MQQLNDLSGKPFGRLTAIRISGKNKYGHTLWLCKCDCGKYKAASLSNLKAGLIKSCGCLQADFVRRFWCKVKKTRKCWLWTGSTTSKNRPYGRIYVNGYATLTHRLSYKLHKGDLKKSEDVLHHCDNPRCVRPSHLFKGSAEDNMRDMVNKGRHKVSMKLSQVDVDKIRSLALGKISQRQIGGQFRIHPSHISRIVSGIYWKRRRP